MARNLKDSTDDFRTRGKMQQPDEGEKPGGMAVGSGDEPKAEEIIELTSSGGNSSDGEDDEEEEKRSLKKKKKTGVKGGEGPEDGVGTGGGIGGRRGGPARGTEVEKKRRALEEAAATLLDNCDEDEDSAPGHHNKRRAPPTGGIKIPGFLRSNTNNAYGNKDMGITDERNGGKTRPVDAHSQDNSHHDDKRPPKLMNAIKLPLASVLPRKLKSTKDSETRVGPAGLASMETLDDSNGPMDGEDNMENVKLDTVETDPEKVAFEEDTESNWAAKDWRHQLRVWRENKAVVGGVVIFLLLLLFVIMFAIFGPRSEGARNSGSTSPFANKYITAFTSCGPIRGLLEDNAAYVFRGVPYAKPPVGHLRWSRPEPLTLSDCWNDTLEATASAPFCWQIFANGSLDGVEDCLTLDVYTPYIRYQSPLPVVVLIGTDSLVGGSPGILLPSPALSRVKEVVFVRPNFRLSVLGFLAGEPLSTSGYPRSSGNYGLHDIAAALKWVQLNVVHFGGNPEQVTVLGYKAGATLVTALTAMHKVNKLFSRAWLSSGASVFPNETLIQSEKRFKGFLESLSCGHNPTIDCLRKLDVEELLDAIPDKWRNRQTELGDVFSSERRHEWLVEDGHIIRENPNAYWARNNVTVQVIMGTTAYSDTSDEAKATYDKLTEEEVIERLSATDLGYYSNQTVGQLAFFYYNTSLREEERDINGGGVGAGGLAAAISDARTVCPLYSVHEQMRNSKLYFVAEGKAGADIEAILGRYLATTREERNFVQLVQRMFYRFVDRGLEPHTPPSVILNAREGTTKPFRKLTNCAFWQKHFPNGNYSRVD